MAERKLYYVIGASGSGKDSLMDYARKHLSSASKPILFAHRYITRQVDAESENYISLSEQEFAIRQALDLFSMHWRSHNYSYGIGIEMDLWLNKGITVVVNGSREYLPQAIYRYPELRVLLIQVDQAVLKQRLVDRGRESQEEIEERLQKAAAYHLPLDKERITQINNNGQLEQAGNRFLQIITQ